VKSNSNAKRKDRETSRRRTKKQRISSIQLKRYRMQELFASSRTTRDVSRRSKSKKNSKKRRKP